MGSYIDESAAKAEVEAIVVEHFDDYSIYVAARKFKTPLVRTVIFGIKTKHAQQGEQLFDAFMKNELENIGTPHVIESEVYLENRVLKELFLVSADVSVSF